LVHGDGSQTRCFCHVKDVVPAMIDMIEHPQAYGRVFNLGSDREVSIKGLAEQILGKTGSQSPIRFIPYHEAYPTGFEDMQRRIPSLERVASLIGFRPVRTLDDILTDVIAEMTPRLEEERGLAEQAS
jgi:UDP-glucose 4-epimerase